MRNTKSNHVLWLKVNMLNNCNFILGAVYLPCESSQNYKFDIFEVINEDINTFDLPVFLLGDFNSRTGIMNDLFNYDDYCIKMFGQFDDDEMDGDYLTRFNADFQRENKDPKVNNMGRALIELCQIQNLNILNGRFGHDKGIGKLTCFNRNQGKRTIDYAVISPTLLEVVNDFEIGEFDEFLSDTHCAISVLLQGNTNKNVARESKSCENDKSNPSSYGTNYSDFCFQWQSDSAVKYEGKLYESDFESLQADLDALKKNSSQSVMNDFCGRLNSLLINTAVKCGICKNKKVNDITCDKKKHNKPWFDYECKRLVTIITECAVRWNSSILISGKRN